MANFRDPIAISRESSACAPQPFLEVRSNSTYLPDEVNKFWSFVDGVYMWARLLLALCRFDMSYDSIFIGAPSWEFIVTLDYEWSVIRRRRPYRWTIWVCNHSLFILRNFSWQQSNLLLDLLPNPFGHPCGCGSKSI